MDQQTPEQQNPHRQPTDSYLSFFGRVSLLSITNYIGFKITLELLNTDVPDSLVFPVATGVAVAIASANSNRA